MLIFFFFIIVTYLAVYSQTPLLSIPRTLFSQQQQQEKEKKNNNKKVKYTVHVFSVETEHLPNILRLFTNVIRVKLVLKTVNRVEMVAEP